MREEKKRSNTQRTKQTNYVHTCTSISIYYTVYVYMGTQKQPTKIQFSRNKKYKKKTYRDHCQHYRCNSFRVRWSNRVRPSRRYRHICIHYPQGYIGHDVNNYFRIQLYWEFEHITKKK